jgi:pyruvate/2-oxoglutarate dehydrogenase complex dihydrolipoamide acyltransferase (E2) component
VSQFLAFLLSVAAAFAEASTFAKATADRSAPKQAVAPQPPANQSPAAASAEASAPKQLAPLADPASSHFASEAGLLLVTIKPTALADYELVIRTLQEAMSKDTDSQRAQAAKGWRVFKAAETDAKGNIVFIHSMMPALANFDYRPSLLLDTLVKDLAPDLLTKYQDAFAAPPTRLSLTEFAHMAVAPVENKKQEM